MQDVCDVKEGWDIVKRCILEKIGFQLKRQHTRTYHPSRLTYWHQPRSIKKWKKKKFVSNYEHFIDNWKSYFCAKFEIYSNKKSW